MNTQEINTPSRQAAVNGLAVVGFIALVAAGMWLAVYSARYVPTALTRIGAAAVSLGSVFVPASSPALSVVPSATSTIISFGDGSTSLTTGATTTATTSTPILPTAPAKVTTPATTAGATSNATYQIAGGTGTPTLSGLPDLVVTIANTGYLTSSSTDSFIASNTVPHGSAAAVKFTIKNVGTNATGLWRFSASIPTQTAYIYQSLPQQNLNPGESIDYTLGFDQANAGAGQMISVTANFDHAVAESNSNNNSASATVTILGS